MTDQPSPDLSDVAAAFADVEIPVRVEHVVVFTTPHGGTVEFPADDETLAKVMAFAIHRDARAAGIADVDVTAVRRTWALAAEEEILTTSPEQPADASRDADGYSVGPRPRWHPDAT
jgi:hypothetical protein